MTSYLLIGTTEDDLKKLREHQIEASPQFAETDTRKGIVISNDWYQYALFLLNAEVVQTMPLNRSESFFGLELRFANHYLLPIQEAHRIRLEAQGITFEPIGEGSDTSISLVPREYRRALRAIGAKEASREHVADRKVKITLTFPSTFFLPFLSAEKISQLDGKIPFEATELDGAAGIRFAASELSQVESLLKGSLEETWVTSQPDVFRCSLLFDSEQPLSAISTDVKLSSNSLRWKEIIQRTLLPAVRMPIVLHDGVRTRINESTLTKDAFHVIFGASPNSSEAAEPPAKIREWSIDYRRAVPKLTAGVDALVESDYVIAQHATPFTLYVALPLSSEGQSSEVFQLLEYVLNRSLRLIRASSEARNSEHQAFLEASVQKSATTYADISMNEFSATKAHAERSRQAALEELERLQTALSNAHDKLRIAETSLSGAKSSEGAFREQKLKEFQAICKLPKVKRVVLQTDRMLVFTKLLYATDPITRVPREIGEFRFEIPYQGSSDSLRWFNLTRKVSYSDLHEMNSPHVRRDGTACFLDRGSNFNRLYARYQYLSIVMLMFDHIEKINVQGDERWGPLLLNQYPIATELLS